MNDAAHAGQTAKQMITSYNAQTDQENATKYIKYSPDYPPKWTLCYMTFSGTGCTNTSMGMSRRPMPSMIPLKEDTVDYKRSREPSDGTTYSEENTPPTGDGYNVDTNKTSPR